MGQSAFWQARLGDASVPVYSPTMHRTAYISSKEHQLLELLAPGRHASLRELLPLTPYSSVSGLWRAVQTLNKLGLLQRMIRAGRHVLRSVRTLVRRDISQAKTEIDQPVTMVRTAPQLSAKLSAMHIGTLLEASPFAALLSRRDD